jgi:hypothetical protein
MGLLERRNVDYVVEAGQSELLVGFRRKQTLKLNKRASCGSRQLTDTYTRPSETSVTID